MFTDPEEARSDLFLAGAVYLFGPLLLSLLGFVRQTPVLGAVFVVAAPIVTTALVPFLMLRYRKESLSDYGIGGGAGLRLGLLVAAPVAGAAALVPFVPGAGLLAASGPFDGTVLALPGASGSGPVVAFLANVATWFGLAFLGLYATVKSRDAFRSEVWSVREGVWTVGRILGVVVVAAVGLLTAVVVGSLPVLTLLLPLGLAAAVVLLHADVDRATTTRLALVAPMILLALRPTQLFALLFNPGVFVESLWNGVVVAAVGLIVAASLEARRSATPAFVLAAALALFVPAAVLFPF